MINMATLIFILVVWFMFESFHKVASSPNNIFILGGQSNMAGRGGVPCDPSDRVHCRWDGYIPPESQSNISILRFNAESSWEIAHEPLHWDIDTSKVNGVGPGMAFANKLLAKANKSIGVVGLVPCAIGGTYIKEWVKGTHKYTKLVERINASEKYGGKVEAFLWFQGESDSIVKTDAEFYEKYLTNFLIDLRSDLNRPNMAIILVKIYHPPIYPIMNFTEIIRRAQEVVKHKLPNIGIVDAEKAIKRVVNHPSFNQDGHLSVYTEIEIGKMLANAYLHKFA